MKINVIVTSYNHEKYITQCMESVLSQTGDFQMEVIVSDDCSIDNTRSILQQFQQKYPEIISLLPPGPNLGVTKNLKRCLDACSGDYIAICEGDDYWTDESKLQKQMTLLETRRDYSMCFSAMMIYYEDKKVLEPFVDQLLLKKDVLTTEDLIENNYIGNFSCCMYRTEVIKKLQGGIFDLFTVDWMFNMACSQFGKIGFIHNSMSIYRKHSKGAWAGKTELENLYRLLPLINSYNKFLGYKYNTLFLKRKAGIRQYIMKMGPQKTELLRNLRQIVDRIPVDLGGGCPLSKSFLMSYLTLEFNLRNYVEIGVYRGRSFFPMAYSVQLTGGIAYGIDPYEYQAAKEYDLAEDISISVNNFMASLDFPEIYNVVKNLQQELGLSDNSEIVRQPSSQAIEYFQQNNITIDMLHINGNHDTMQVMEDIDLYLPFVRNGGFVVMDDINFDSVKPAVNRLKRKFDIVFNNGQFAIFSIGTLEKAITPLQKSRYSILHGMSENLDRIGALGNALIPESTELPVVSVVVITFNQEKYIGECLEGIFAQKGDIKMS